MNQIIKTIAVICATIIYLVLQPIASYGQITKKAESLCFEMYMDLKNISDVNNPMASLKKAEFNQKYFVARDQNAPYEFGLLGYDNQGFSTDVAVEHYVLRFFNMFRDPSFADCTFDFKIEHSSAIEQPADNAMTPKYVLTTIKKSYLRRGVAFANIIDTVLVGIERMKVLGWTNKSSSHHLGFTLAHSTNSDNIYAAIAMAYKNKQFDLAYQICQTMSQKFPNACDPYYYMAELLSQNKCGKELSKEQKRETVLKYIDNVYAKKDGYLKPILLDDLKRGKFVILPKIVQKWLSFFYEAKYSIYPILSRNDKWLKRDFAYLMQDSTNAKPFVHGLMPIFKGGKRIPKYSLEDIDGELYGYMNEQGQMITPYKYIWAEPFSEKYAVARVALGVVGYFKTTARILYGVLNTNGQLVTKGKYYTIRPFVNGLAAVENSNRLWGFINPKGEEVIPCSYESITNYMCGWIGFSDGKSCWYANLKGEKINNEKYIDIYTFDESSQLALVAKLINGKKCFGVIDTTGKTVIPLEYYSIKINKDMTVKLRKTKVSTEQTVNVRDFKKVSFND